MTFGAVNLVKLQMFANFVNETSLYSPSKAQTKRYASEPTVHKTVWTAIQITIANHAAKVSFSQETVLARTNIDRVQ